MSTIIVPYHNTITHGDSSTPENIDWVTLEKELLDFMKKDNLDSIKKTSEEALEAVREKKLDKFKNILAASGKVGLEIFSKVTGTMLAEIAKNMMNS